MNIPLALSFDDNYAPYAYVVAYSALKNKSPDTCFHFYFLVPSNLEKKHKRYLTSLCDEYSCEVTFIDMKNRFSTAKTWGYFTVPVYYRLSLEDLVSEDKCIYLDCDTLVLGDLSELFSIDIENYYAAGVRDSVNVNKPQYLDDLAICEPMTYINTGVMLLNLKKLRENKVKNRVDKLIKDKNFQKKSKFLDQDALNKIYSGNVKMLSPRFNWFDRFTKNFRGNLIIKNLYPDINLASVKPLIVHFIGNEKPWFVVAKPEGKFIDMWWKCAKETEIYPEILLKASEFDVKFSVQTVRGRFKNLADYLRCKLLSFFCTSPNKKEHYKMKAARMYERWKFAQRLLQK